MKGMNPLNSPHLGVIGGKRAWRRRPRNGNIIRWWEGMIKLSV